MLKCDGYKKLLDWAISSKASNRGMFIDYYVGQVTEMGNIQIG